MREFKFRAWEKNMKEIIPVYDISFDKKMINTESLWRMFDEIELMQYTGLHDINGKEIYEGDIIKIEIPDEDSAFGNTFEHIVKIYWDNYRSCYKFNDGKYHVMGKEPWINKYATLTNIREQGAEFEVIGNIYENPELLNK